MLRPGILHEKTGMTPYRFSLTIYFAQVGYKTRTSCILCFVAYLSKVDSQVSFTKRWCFMQVLLTLSYDGTTYAGWQRQNNAVAIQQKLEEALSDLFCTPIITRAASRTDAGVHALGQCATFFMDGLPIPIKKLPQVINGHLPSDISITNAEVVTDDFNPRFDAKYKTYTYNIYNAKVPNPLLARYSAFVPRILDTQIMNKAAALLVGYHDFAAFMATGSNTKTTTRQIYSCAVSKQPSGLVSITVTGNGFLYNMVRIIAGTLTYAGLGKLPYNAIPEIIQSLDRRKAGKTMPPQGLTLIKVGYTTYSELE